MPPQKTHLHYIDALRVFAFLLVIPYHTAMLFTQSGWLVKAVERVPWFDLCILWLHQWRLPLLFMVSGMGVAIAFQNKTYCGFIFERTKRLLIPLVVALPLVIMPQQFTTFMYLGYILEGAPYQFWPQWGRLFIQIWEVGHLWFIQYLLVITLFISPFIWGLKRFKLGTLPIGLQLLSWTLFLGSFLGWEFYLRPLYPETNYFFTDWANMSLFAHFFLGGYLVMIQRKIIASISNFKWVLLGIGALLMLIEVLVDTEYLELAPWQIGTRLLGIICFVLGLLGLAFRYFNKPNKTVAYLNGSLYPVYIWHQTIIVTLGYEIAKWHFNPLGQYALVMAGTILFCYAIYEGLLKPYGWLGNLFGVKPRLETKIARYNVLLSGIAVAMLAALYFVPRTADSSLAKPTEIAEEFAGDIPVTLTAQKPEHALFVPLLISDFTNGAYVPMLKTDSGYAITVNLKPGTYKYLFLIDESYQTDPKNLLTSIDERGTKKSILRVKAE